MKDKGLIYLFCHAGVNVLCGVGILSTPYAVKQGGWLGLVILAVLGALAWYTGILLRRCLDSKEGLETYPDIGHAAFGTSGRIIISVSILFSTPVMRINSSLYSLHYTVQCSAVLC
jgi:amino acid permease